jgi:hypothetical protein
MFKIASVISGLLALAGSLSAQAEPHAGQWKTWIISSGSSVRLPAPPDAADTAIELQWVKACAAHAESGCAQENKYSRFAYLFASPKFRSVRRLNLAPLHRSISGMPAPRLSLDAADRTTRG